MTKNEIFTLMKDLSGRLCYDVLIKYKTKYDTFVSLGVLTADLFSFIFARLVTIPAEVTEATGEEYKSDTIEIIKPCLRPLSSMTPDEERTWIYYKSRIAECSDDDLCDNIDALHEWLNMHHFDWRHLIEKGLAEEADSETYADTVKSIKEEYKNNIMRISEEIFKKQNNDIK